MIRLNLIILGVGLDFRIMSSASQYGCSLFYVRLDVGCRTALMLDVERVGKQCRASPLEYLVKLGPLQSTNRSYYVGA